MATLNLMDLTHFFSQPASAAQRQYEAIRAIVVDKLSVEDAAAQFHYSVNTLYSLMRDIRADKVELFPLVKKRGPKQRHTPPYIQALVLSYRKQGLSCTDVSKKLISEGYKLSTRTVENIVADFNLPRLPRRTQAERGMTQRNEWLPLKTVPLDYQTLKPFQLDCPVAGIFFFLPYIIESGVIDIIKACPLPESSAISATQACLSMLLLKLMGNKRLSHIQAYNHEPTLGLFAGLNFLPKPTYMATYSCRTSQAMIDELQQQVIRQFEQQYPQFYCAEFINLDFHSIPHFGTESSMEKVWCGARGKAMKGANTLLAQDANSNAILYTQADILRKDEAKTIQNFITYWKNIKGDLTETLVFDCKLTTYAVLDEMAQDNINFITLRKRNKKLLKETQELPESQWQRLRINIPKRKHKACSVYESLIKLPKCENKFRQIIIKNHGRSEPTFVITNQENLPLKTVLEVYAKRWRIENKIAEMVAFFNLNALSSPLMIRIHFDLLWTMIADTLYHRFAQDLPRFEHCRADTLFRKFIDMPGEITYDETQFKVKIRKRACSPILLGVKVLTEGIRVPWLENKSISVEWTA